MSSCRNLPTTEARFLRQTRGNGALHQSRAQFGTNQPSKHLSKTRMLRTVASPGRPTIPRPPISILLRLLHHSQCQVLKTSQGRGSRQTPRFSTAAVLFLKQTKFQKYHLFVSQCLLHGLQLQQRLAQRRSPIRLHHVLTPHSQPRLQVRIKRCQSHRHLKPLPTTSPSSSRR